ncbi:murein L,D-transpeptidase [bacterium]|nr:murein L,D-transpeptidase [bacterium]
MRTGLISTLFGTAPTQRRGETISKILAGGDDTPAVAPSGDRLSLSGAPKNGRFADAPELRAAMAGQAVRLGAKGEGVKAVQVALLDLGFALPAGADGAFGAQTTLALKNFQASQGLPKTGELDAATMRSLDEVAPAPGLKAWEDPNLSPKAFVAPEMVKGKPSRGVAAIDQHRFFLYDRQGKLEKIYPIATGKGENATDAGIKIVSGKLADPTNVAKQLWPESGGRAFGTRLVDLSWYDPNTGKSTRSGEELHGTFDRNSIGRDASHGCMRFFNEDIEEVYNRLKVGDVVVTKA